MFTQCFGKYLLEAQLIAEEQFENALQQMSSKRARLGVLAIDDGVMTPYQVEETVSAQLQMDKKFGEIALARGFLTESALEALLHKQGSPFAVFSQVLIDNGYLTYAALASHLSQFKEHCGLREDDFISFKGGDNGRMIHKLYCTLEDTPERLSFMEAYTALFVRNLQRFIGNQVLLGPVVKNAVSPGAVTALQELSGPISFVAALSGDDQALCYFSGRFAKARFDTLDDMARDILGEFLNCNNGVFIANALELGVDLELCPQEVTEDFSPVDRDTYYCMQFSVDKRPYQLTLAF